MTAQNNTSAPKTEENTPDLTPTAPTPEIQPGNDVPAESVPEKA